MTHARFTLWGLYQNDDASVADNIDVVFRSEAGFLNPSAQRSKPTYLGIGDDDDKNTEVDLHGQGGENIERPGHTV